MLRLKRQDKFCLEGMGKLKTILFNQNHSNCIRVLNDSHELRAYCLSDLFGEEGVG